MVIPSFNIADHESAIQAAEDDWDLLGVPPDRTLSLGLGKSPILDAAGLQAIDSGRLYEALRNIGRDTKKVNVMKPLSEQVKSMNAVTL